jgi:hypothetical protein
MLRTRVTRKSQPVLWIAEQLQSQYCATGKDNVCNAYICGLPGALEAGVIAGVSVNAAPNAALMECCTGICLVVALPFEAAIRPKAVFGGGMRPAPG